MPVRLDYRRALAMMGREGGSVERGRGAAIAHQACSEAKHEREGRDQTVQQPDNRKLATRPNAMRANGLFMTGLRPVACDSITLDFSAAGTPTDNSTSGYSVQGMLGP